MPHNNLLARISHRFPRCARSVGPPQRRPQPPCSRTADAAKRYARRWDRWPRHESCGRPV